MPISVLVVNEVPRETKLHTIRGLVRPCLKVTQPGISFLACLKSSLGFV